MKDEDSDMDVPEDEGSDSDVEESRPSKPRPTRNGIMAGTQTRESHVLDDQPVVAWNIFLKPKFIINKIIFMKFWFYESDSDLKKCLTH